MTFRENIFPILTAVTLAIISFLIVFMLTLYIACLISPAIYIDEESGEKFSIMPIGQTIIAIISATTFSILTLILSLKYFRKLSSKAKK